MMMQLILVLGLSLVISSCGNGIGEISHSGVCDGYPDWKTSVYKLPFAVGTSHKIGQGNCGGVSHIGPDRYAYDMRMDIGTHVLAVRGGTVFKIEQRFNESSGCPNNNYVYVKHSDGSVARYLHIDQNSAQVTVGASVNQGDYLARSGNVGCSTGPHLHFDVMADEELKESIPVTFLNTDSNPRGLQTGKTYLAK